MRIALKTIFQFLRFILVQLLVFETWSILYMVDFDACMQKTEEIFANMPLTLTSEARVLNPKTCAFPGCSPR